MSINQKVYSLSLLTFWIISVGLIADLILIGHYQTIWQTVPLLMQFLAVFAVLVYHNNPISRLEKIINSLVVLLILSGVAGVGFHLHNNWQFEVELHPGQSVTELIQNVTTGAVPIMTPGAMIVSGLAVRLIIISKS
ncbi:MAG: hypothetical protein AAFQ94_13840 [Bacteroidota bacterium]